MTTIPEVPWSDFWPQFRRDYRASRDNAQHVSIFGPNGTGKTTLSMSIADLRPYVCVFGCKPRDEEMRRMLRQRGYRKMDVLPAAGAGVRRVVLWPKNHGLESVPVQRSTFDAAFAQAFRAGVWHLVVDEGHYVAHTLRLGERIRTALQMGRSNGHALILSAQRPAWLPRDVYSAATHLFLFGTNDAADLRSIAGLNGVSDKLVRDTVAQLGRDHRFLYVNTATGDLRISRMVRSPV